tara:strand:+ start:22649 stop:24115 length:1467 start_codon:yes stop_codon:yes gene_type:complete
MKNANNKNWFNVSTQGLKVQCEEIGLKRLTAELIANSFDENSVSKIEVTIKKFGEIFHIRVDDDGEGFKKISDAFTLFDDSGKRIDPTKRGRFNLGEKQWISLCKFAQIDSGKIRITFDDKGRHSEKIAWNNNCKIFGEIRNKELTSADLVNYLNGIIVPKNKILTINGDIAIPKTISNEFKTELPTPVASGKFQKLRNLKRETALMLYEIEQDEQAWLYEQGIPVCKLEDNFEWHVNVHQKIPQVSERNVVKASYLKLIYTAIAEKCTDLIDEDNAGSKWISDALENTNEETTKVILNQKFGTDKIMIAGTDYRANEKAMEAGYKLVKGSELNMDIKSNLKESNLIDYTSKVFSSNNFVGAEVVEPTENMKFFAKVCNEIAEDTIDKSIKVGFITTEVKEVANYGGDTLTWNMRFCGGKKAFDDFENNAYLLGVVIHELAHDKIGNNEGFAHLSHEYLHEQERIAGICFKHGIDYYINRARISHNLD